MADSELTTFGADTGSAATEFPHRKTGSFNPGKFAEN